MMKKFELCLFPENPKQMNTKMIFLTMKSKMESSKVTIRCLMIAPAKRNHKNQMKTLWNKKEIFLTWKNSIRKIFSLLTEKLKT